MASDLDFFECKNWSLFRRDPLTVTPRWMLAVLVLGFGIVLALVAWHAFAQAPVEPPQYVYDEGRTSIRLMRGPCTDARTTALIISLGGGQYLERFKAIESTWPHRDGSVHDYPGCWLELAAGELGAEEPTLLLVFSDGTQAAVRKSEFVKARGAGA